MNEKREFYGIYINNKIPKLKDNKNYNKYYNKIELNFEGKAYIIDNGKEKEELKNNSKYKKKGKHTIKYINTKNEIYFIDIEIKRYGLIWLFFILLILLLGSLLLLIPPTDKKKYKIDEAINFDVDFEANKYVFNINFGNTEFQNISLTDSVKNKKLIYPGTKGAFYVQISTKNGNKDMLYSMQIQDELNKPNNLKFEIDGKKYNSMKELSESINGTIQKDTNKILKIKWFWEYESDNGDFIDTKDGETIENYKVLIRMMGTVKED